MRLGKASTFDLDYTLIKANCSFEFCRYLVRCRILPKSALFLAVFVYLKHRFFGLSLEEMHKVIFQKILMGLHLPTLEKHVEIFIKKHLVNRLYAPAVAYLRRAQHLGHYTAILSSSPSFLVKPIAKFFQVDEWRASVYEVDQQKRFSGISFVLQGRDKAKYVQELAKRAIRQENVIAFSDSHLDIPFLLSAGCAVIVNPDRKLRRFSQKHNWSMI